MSIRFLILSIVCSLTYSFSFSQDFQWVKEIQEESKSNSRLTITDDNDLILAENFNTQISIGNEKIKSYGNNDFILVKYEPKGKVEWIRHFGSSANEEIKGIAGDLNGNVFITGYFTGKITLGTVNLSSNGKEDVFVAKIDKKGNCQWAVPYGSKGTDKASCLSLDKEGNIIISGSLRNDSDSLNTIFISKYNRNGIQIWNKKLQSADSRSESRALITNHSNDVIIAGIFYDNLLMNNASLFRETNTVEDMSNLFLLSLDKQGNFSWSNLLATLDFDSFISMESALACDERDNVYLGASFIGSINIGDKYYNSSGIGNQDIFIASCTKQGKWKWILASEGNDSNYGRDYFVSLKVHKNGIIYGTGYFDGGLKLGSLSLSENKELYDSDIFIVSLDTTGNVLWGKQAGASTKEYFTFDDNVSDLAVNEKEEIFLAGNSDGNAKFDKIQLKSTGKTCNYFAKISKSSRTIFKDDIKAANDTLMVSIYPNPTASEDVTIKVEGTGEKIKVLLYDNWGNQVLQLFYGKTKRKELYQFVIKSSELQEGLYHLKLISNDSTSSHKIIISK